MRTPIALAAFVVVLATQAPLAQIAASAGAAQQVAALEGLPVRRVVLYKTGVGYFEHRGRVTDSQDVAIRFTSGQLNDALKSLTALDLGSGRIASISYNSVAPLERRINALRLPVDGNATLVDMLSALRGARVTVTTGGASVAGRLLSVERQRRQVDANRAAEMDVVSIVTDAGDMRTYEIGPTLRIRVADRELREEIGQYLDLVGAAREQDIRRVIIRTAGSGERELHVSYVSEVPVWKTTYRLVMGGRGASLLQGWAIVDNTIGEDWTNVQLSLIAGAPQTFVQQISQPYYARRPVVPLPQRAVLTPQTHGGTLEMGPGTLAGSVRDVSGRVLPGVRVLARDRSRQASALTDPEGNYRLTAPAGVYQVEFQLPGFSRVVREGVDIAGGLTHQLDASMRVGRLEETITLSGETAAVAAPSSRNMTGVMAGVVSGASGGTAGGGAFSRAQSEIVDSVRAMQPAASASDLGDLFEYRITEPVTIGKDESALVPILSAEVEAEKVSLWTRTSGSGRPLHAVWLTNTSGLTLDGGSFSVVEGGAFAGEGLMDPLEPGERRLLSYAADLGVLVSAELGGPASRIVRLRAHDGVIVQDVEERTTAVYRIRNEDAAPRSIVVEHPVRNGWELAPDLEPAERSVSTYRFRVPLGARREVALEVSERRATESSISMSEVDESRLELWTGSGIAAADLEGALKPVIEKRTELAAIERDIAQLEADRKAVADDQQRLRENLKALGRSSEERQLIERYTRQLNDQEDRLETVLRELTRATSERARLWEELGRLIADVTFEVNAES